MVNFSVGLQFLPPLSMLAIVPSTSDFAAGHSNIVRCLLTTKPSCRNSNSTRIVRGRHQIEDGFRGFLTRIPSGSARALNRREMQGFESNNFGLACGNGVGQGGVFGTGVAVKAGGEKTTMDPNAEHAVAEPNPNPNRSSIPGIICPPASTVGKSTNIVWQECSVNKEERQALLQQKGCVIWITGLSGSGKSTLACALSRALHFRGKLTYILDGDNVRHGLNKNLGFSADDRAENIRRIGEVAKLFVDAGVICIASLISPYRRDRDACRALLTAGEFIEIFMNFPLELCEERDSKGLYKLARAGKIKGFTGIDDPYEPPLGCELVMQPINGVCPSPKDMAEQVVAYLKEKGFIGE